MAKTLIEELHAEEGLLGDIDHLRTDMLHNKCEKKHLLADIDRIDQWEGKLDGSLLKWVRKELESLAKKKKVSEEDFHPIIARIMKEQVETRHKMGQM